MTGFAGPQKRILLYEPRESDSLGNDLVTYLEKEGFIVERAANEAETVKYANQRWYRAYIIGVNIARYKPRLDEIVTYLDKFPLEIPKIVHADVVGFLYPEIGRIRNTLRKTHQKVEFVQKAEYDQLLDTLHSLEKDPRFKFNDSLRLRSAIQIDPIHQLMGMLETVSPELYGSIKSELEDLFRLGFDGSIIEFEKVLWQKPGRLAIQILTSYLDRPEERFVAIITKRNQHNIDQKQKFADFPKVIRQINSKLTTHYSLEVNMLEGEPGWPRLKPIQEFLNNRNREEIQRYIKQVNKFILSGWQNNHRRTSYQKDISKTIRNHLNLGQPNQIAIYLRNQIHKLEALLLEKGIGLQRDGNTLVFQVDGGRKVLLDPIGLVTAFLKEEYPGNMIHVPCQINLNTIFVDPKDSRVWITDLSGQGDVPKYWPETDLELSVRQILAVDLQKRFQLEQELIGNPSKLHLRNIQKFDKQIVEFIQNYQKSTLSDSEDDQKSYQIVLAYKVLARLCKLDIDSETGYRNVDECFQLVNLLSFILRNFAEHRWIAYNDLTIKKNGVITYDEEQGVFTIDNKITEISEAPKKLLKYFVANPNKYLDYKKIAREAFNYTDDFDGISFSSIEEQIQQNKSRLQAALKKQSPGWEYFDKHRVNGYCFLNPPRPLCQKAKKKR